MATIHMEVDGCRSTAQAMGSAKEAIDSQVNTLMNTVNNTVGSLWIANSATEFQNSFQEWARALAQITEQLASLQQRLNNEISEFEQSASRLA